MKSLLCKLGIHKPIKDYYIVSRRVNGKHKWHRNYIVCERCGKRLEWFAIRK